MGWAMVMRRALFGSVEFIAAYQAAMVAKPPPVGAARTIAGSVNAVIVSYYQSAEFKGSRASAARVYRNILERFREAHGDKSAVGMRTKHVRKLMAEKAATPDAANRMLGMISILMEQAIALGLRDDNPCVGVKKLKHKGGGFATWNEDQIAAYRAHHPLGSRERLVLELALGAAISSASAGGMSATARSRLSKARPARLSPSPLSASFKPLSIKPRATRSPSSFRRTGARWAPEPRQ